MYHTEHGKTTLEMWGEEQDATKNRKRELTNVATVLVALERLKSVGTNEEQAVVESDAIRKEGDK